MAMQLTQDDLAAIDGLFRADINYIKQSIDDLAIDTAAGFAEVHNRIDGVKSELDDVKSDLADVRLITGRIERVQLAEVKRLDSHDLTLRRVRKALKIT